MSHICTRHFFEGRSSESGVRLQMVAWLLPTRAGIRAGLRAAQRAPSGLQATRAASNTGPRRLGRGIRGTIGVGVGAGVICFSSFAEHRRLSWLPVSCAPTTAALPALPATTVEDEGGASVVDAIVAAIQRSPTPTRVCRPALHYQSLAVHNCRLPPSTRSLTSLCASRHDSARGPLLPACAPLDIPPPPPHHHPQGGAGHRQDPLSRPALHTGTVQPS